MKISQCWKMFRRQRCYLNTRLTSMTPVRVCLSCLCLLVVLSLVFPSWPCPRADSSELRQRGLIHILPDHHGRSRTNDDDSLLKSVPPTVHFMWCGSSSFQFQHYLSVLSAYRLLQPTEILFHYQTQPLHDAVAYYRYYDDLLRDVPNLFPLPLDDGRVCDQSSSHIFRYVTKLLSRHGGVFLGINVVLSENIQLYVKKGVSTRDPGLRFDAHGIMLKSPESGSKTMATDVPCAVSVSAYTKQHPCVSVRSEIYPADVFHLETDFGQLARFMGYGTSDALTPNPAVDLIPNIVHYIWTRKGTLSFLAYTSILSTLFVQEAETVYVHCYHEPEGQYWDSVKHLPRLKVVRRLRPWTVYGVNGGGQADFPSLDLLHRYGGIFVDWDVVWVRPLSASQRKFEALASVDLSHDGIFPGYFNLGILVARKGATFLKLVMESFRQEDGHRALVSLDTRHLAYKVYERHPQSVHVAGHLQAKCDPQQCHSTWLMQRNYGNESMNKGGTFKSLDWRTDTNVVSWESGISEDFDDRATLAASTGLSADIVKYVLKKAGML